MSLIRPASWLIYILVLGAISGWYPYPLLDVDRLGHPAVLLSSVLVMVLLLGSGAVYRLLDRGLPRRETGGHRQARRGPGAVRGGWCG